jgi:hypothetical protein
VTASKISPSNGKSPDMTPLNQRLARRGRLVLPLLASVLVALLLGAAVIIPRLTASPRSDGAAIAAFSDNGGTRDLIILDPHTGELLANEHTAMRDPGALGITQPTVVTYTPYVTHTYTPSMQQR